MQSPVGFQFRLCGIQRSSNAAAAGAATTAAAATATDTATTSGFLVLLRDVFSFF